MATSQNHPPKEESATLTFGDLNKLIENKATELIGKLTGKQEPPKPDDKPVEKPTETPTGSLDEQIQKGIAALKAQEARDAKEKERDDTIAGLVEKTKDKAPVERSRTHRFMGWGE